MNFNFKVTLPKGTILQGVVQLSADGSLTPIVYYSEDRRLSEVEWEIKVAIRPRDELYLRYELPATSEISGNPSLVIHGILDSNSVHGERRKVSKDWKSITIRLSDFNLELFSSWFSITVFEPAAELPRQVTEHFKNWGRGNVNPFDAETHYELGEALIPDEADYSLNEELLIIKDLDYTSDESIADDDQTEPPFSPALSTTSFPVWYATNRQGIYDNGGKLTGFSAERAPTTTYGKCLVDIPESHVIGETRASIWQRAWLTVTFRKDESALRLLEIQPATSATAYWTEIQHAATKWPSNQRCGLVFIHGYNVSFEEAALRAAQIGADLQVRGPVGFFSWPSRGTLLGYAADEAAIEASEEQITQYLLDFARESQTERVHIIAHSMGNRGLLRALQRIAANAAATAPKLFEQIILAAPDVDKALFLSLAEHYHRLARHTTLYVSNKDLALASSRMLRIGMDRAGLTPPVTIAPNIDTVNVTNIDMTLLGHGYVAEARDVLADMHQLLYQNAPPDERMGLRPAEEAGQRYWVIGA